eukprot:scaffold4024_cov128-Isochrysis_galbana.AAC.3
MGDPSRYPEIRIARFLYAMQWLPPDLRADYHLRQQWIDNNMSYLDARALAVLQDGDHTFRRDSWLEYTTIFICAALACAPTIPLDHRCVWPFYPNLHHS